MQRRERERDGQRPGDADDDGPEHALLGVEAFTPRTIAERDTDGRSAGQVPDEQEREGSRDHRSRRGTASVANA